MEGEIIAVILGGFVTVWLQIALLYYKIGRIEQKLDMLNNNHVRR